LKPPAKCCDEDRDFDDPDYDCGRDAAARYPKLTALPANRGNDEVDPNVRRRHPQMWGG